LATLGGSVDLNRGEDDKKVRLRVVVLRASVEDNKLWQMWAAVGGVDRSLFNQRKAAMREEEEEAQVEHECKRVCVIF